MEIEVREFAKMLAEAWNEGWEARVKQELENAANSQAAFMNTGAPKRGRPPKNHDREVAQQEVEMGYAKSTLTAQEKGIE